MPVNSEPRARPVLCVDIGGTSTKAAILSADGVLSFLQTMPTRPSGFFAALTGLIRQVHANATGDILEMGVGIAGFLDDARSRLIYNPNLEWLVNVPLRDLLSKAFPDMQIELEIDSNAAAVAEYRFGAAKQKERLLCVTCGTGIGVGFTIKGAPLRFTYGCLGDMGHVIVNRDGPLCTCGGRGCAEATLAGPVLLERYRNLASASGEVTLSDVIQRAMNGDLYAQATINQAGEDLGVALASMANILFPDHIAIAGGLSAAGDLLLQPAIRMFRQFAGTAVCEKASVALATLGPLAPLIGAAWPFWPTDSRASNAS